MLRRLLISTAAALSFLSLPLSQASSQQNDSAAAERTRSLIELHKGDFDYLLGDWRFTARSATWGEFAGVWSALRLATGGGAHVLDEYRVTGDSGETFFASSTLRVYNPARDRWELVSVHETSGLEDAGTARKIGAEMHIEQTFGANTATPERWRIRYFEIGANGFKWAADRSFDGGSTWERNHMTLTALRVGPARTLPPLASTTIGGR